MASCCVVVCTKTFRHQNESSRFFRPNTIALTSMLSRGFTFNNVLELRKAEWGAFFPTPAAVSVHLRSGRSSFCIPDQYIHCYWGLYLSLVYHCKRPEDRISTRNISSSSRDEANANAIGFDCTTSAKRFPEQ